MPLLQIRKQTEPELFSIYDTDHPPRDRKIKIVVENNGRNAALDCRGYVILGHCRNRICWTAETARPNATINPATVEHLDLCAFLLSSDECRNSIIIPDETGWKNSKCIMPILSEEITVLVTSENADPVEANAVIDFDRKEVEFD